MTRKYKESGVDIEAGNLVVKKIANHLRSTFRPEVLTDIGSFGGLFALDMKKFSEPVLVSSTDGVGTKLKIAFLMDKHDTVGQDLVAMCVNDILVHGAEPLFFLDYIAMGKLVPSKILDIVQGIAYGCKLAGCSLIGGETAEMPGFYAPEEYDLAGFAVGVVEKNRVVDGSKVQVGDILLGLPSSGLHSNGYSLVRKIFLEEHHIAPDSYIPTLRKTLGEELLIPTNIYVQPVLELLTEVEIKGMVHITGGGFIENIPRSLPEGLGVTIDKSSWIIPPIFNLIQEYGKITEEEMFSVFNMGIGYILMISPNEEEKAQEIFLKHGLSSYRIGQVISKPGVVIK